MATKDMKNLAHAQGDTPEELENLTVWWNEHGNLVTIILLVVLAVVVGVRQFNGWRERRQAAAVAELHAAADPEALEALIRKGPASVVPLARLQLGSYYYGRHNYDLARSAYQAILDESPSHALAAPLAEVGLAQCAEALGDPAKAASLFASFHEKNPDSYLAPLATLGQARCLILQGTDESRAEGKRMLDLFLTETPGSTWASQADELIRARARLTVPAVPAADLESMLGAPEVSAAPEADVEAMLAEPAPAPAAEPAPAPAAEPAPAPAAEPAPAPDAAEAAKEP